MSSKKSKTMAELMDSACFKWHIMAKVLIIISRCFIICFSCCLKYSCSVFFPRMMTNHVPSDFLPLMKNNIEGFISLHILPRQIRTTWPTISSLFKFGSKRKYHLRTDGGKGLVSHWSNIANWPLRGSKNTPNEQVWNRQEIKMRSKSVSGDRQQSDLSGWKILIEIKEAALVRDFMLLIVWPSPFFQERENASFVCPDSVRIDNTQNARLSRFMMWKNRRKYHAKLKRISVESRTSQRRESRQTNQILDKSLLDHEYY